MSKKRTKRAKVKRVDVDPKEELLNCADLAAALNCCESYVTDMRRCGYKFLYGTETTLRHALQWRANYPDFRRKYALPHYIHLWFDKHPELKESAQIVAAGGFERK